MKHEKIKEGDVLYELVQRRNQPPQIEKRTVSKVGRVYFYTDDDNWNRNPYRVDTLRYEDKRYSQYDRQLYRTEQEIKDYLEYGNLKDEMRKAFTSFSMPNYTLDQLRRIKSIIDEPKQ